MHIMHTLRDTHHTLGIGAKTAQLMADKGAEVKLLARNKEKLDTLVTEIIEHGGKANRYIVDARGGITT